MKASDDGVDSHHQKRHKKLAYDEQKERLRLDRLAEAVLSLPSSSTEYIFAEGCSLLEKGKTTLAFQHLDLCVLKQPEEWQFRLVRSMTAFHLKVLTLAINDAALALDLMEDDDVARDACTLQAKMPKALRDKVECETRRSKAQCAYWLGKAHFAHGDFDDARSAFLRADQIFPSEMAKYYLAQTSTIALDTYDMHRRSLRLKVKRLFFDPSNDDAHFLQDVLTHPKEAFVPAIFHEALYAFDRTSYDLMLCDLIDDFYVAAE